MLSGIFAATLKTCDGCVICSCYFFPQDGNINLPRFQLKHTHACTLAVSDCWHHCWAMSVSVNQVLIVGTSFCIHLPCHIVGTCLSFATVVLWKGEAWYFPRWWGRQKYKPAPSDRLWTHICTNPHVPPKPVLDYGALLAGHDPTFIASTRSYPETSLLKISSVSGNRFSTSAIWRFRCVRVSYRMRK